jgi:hypothetical protein
MSEFSLKHGNIEDLNVHTPLGTFNISDLVDEFRVSESIFSPFITGSFTFSDTESVRIMKNTGLREDLSCKVSFAFSGLEDDGKTSQKPITISESDYYIFQIDVGEPKGTGTQRTTVHFAHKSFLKNQASNISRSYQKKKIHEMISDLAKSIELEWNQFENTVNTFNFVLTYRTVLEQIMFLVPYSVREENDSDVNFVFYQDLDGKHNFVSIGKLMTQPPTFGNDPNSGYFYSLNPGSSFYSSRRCAITHATKTLNSYESGLKGMHSSVVSTVDSFTKTWAATGYFMQEKWDKQSHLSSTPVVNQNSELYEFVNGSMIIRNYVKSRHSHCCKEQKNGNDKVGGEKDWLLPRISQIEQLNQIAIEFFVTGNSDTSKIGAGKVIFFGRPILNESVNSSQGADLAFSGKYLVTSVTHILRKAKSGKVEYGTNFVCIKDSLGEE